MPKQKNLANCAPFTAAEIRDLLPPLNLSATGADYLQQPKVRCYRQFYQLDFEKTIPLIPRLGMLQCADFAIATQVFQLQKPVGEIQGTLFILHGLYDHVGLYAHLIGFLLQQNYNVVAIDLPGHGLSSGDPTAIKSFDDYQQVIQAVVKFFQGKIPQPWYALGQSTGGAIFIDALLNKTLAPNPFQKTVLFAPLIRPFGWSKSVKLYNLLHYFLNYVPRLYARNSHDQNFLHFVKKQDPLQSVYLSVDWVGALKQWIPYIEAASESDQQVLIIQGEEDATVDWRYNLAFLETRLAQLQIARFPELRHHVVNEIESIRAKVFERVLGFLNQD